MQGNILPFQRLDGFISNVYLSGAPQDTSSAGIRSVANAITYDARFIVEGEVTLISGFKPYNRSFENAGIISAKANDYCDVVIALGVSRAMVYVHTEKDDLYDCQKNPIEDA